MKQCILIIDDNRAMSTFLFHLLGDSHEVITKESAEEAVNWLNDQNIPNLIISDYELEGISGYQLLKLLKSSVSYQAIPFLMLSGKSKVDYRVECLQAGAEEFVLKPFNPAELKLRVERILQSRLNKSVGKISAQ